MSESITSGRSWNESGRLQEESSQGLSGDISSSCCLPKECHCFPFSQTAKVHRYNLSLLSTIGDEKDKNKNRNEG